jgi:hypothetical protein
MKRTALLIVFLVLSTAFSFGATVDGTWKGSVDDQDGNASPITYSFKANGNTLTGTVIGGGKTMPIRNGKIDGQKISFIVDVDVPGQKMTFEYDGEVSAAQIKLHAYLGGQVIDIVVKKVK